MKPTPAQLANLKKFNSETGRAAGKKGAKTTNEMKRNRARFNEALKEMLSAEDQEVMLKTLILKAKRGDLTALDYLLRLLGEDAAHTDTEEKKALAKAEELLGGVQSAID